MGKTDKVQKEAFRNPEWFADLWNALVFDGKQVIKPDELLPGSESQFASNNGTIIEKITDICMQWCRNGRKLRIVNLLLENQMTVDYSMVVRVMSEEVFDYNRQVREIVRKNEADYRKLALAKKQEVNENDPAAEGKGTDSSGEFLYKFKKSDRLKPVSTLVLYWGKKEWDGAVSLKDLIDFEGYEELEPLVQDYKINLVNMNEFTEDKGRKFINDEIRDVVTLFSIRRDKRKFYSYITDHQDNMVSSVMEAISVLVDSAELKNYIEKNRDKLEKEGRTMCQAITELIADGRQEGMDFINIMYSKLKAAGRNDDLYRSIDDPVYQRKLLHEFFPDKFSEKI